MAIIQGTNSPRLFPSTLAPSLFYESMQTYIIYIYIYILIINKKIVVLVPVLCLQVSRLYLTFLSVFIYILKPCLLLREARRRPKIYSQPSKVPVLLNQIISKPLSSAVTRKEVPTHLIPT